MSLRDVAELHVFASVTSHEELVRLYVRSTELAGLGGGDRPEAQIVRPLCTSDPPQRLHIHGPAGAGKTSLILRALADIAQRETLARPTEPLFVNCGDSPQSLNDPQRFMQMILGLIEVNGARFANVDPGRLLEATAQQTTHTPAKVTHQAGIAAPVVSYQASLSEAFKTHSIGKDPARVRHDFEDVVRTVATEHRPVIVIDDTDHFASAEPDGDPDEDAINNLYHHGIRTLAEFEELDIIVAIQPRFRSVSRVAEVEGRFNFQPVEVAALDRDRDDPPLGLVLARRLEAAGIAGSVDDLVDPRALAQLQGAYFMLRQDLRHVLELTDRAAHAAVSDGDDRIALRHVQAVLGRS